ncbi:MAG TPA: hypothetical protein VNW50_04350 [Streptosporangiaceae bacterium]|nr:hypothetical protein [Streptosporangiaceae bacterium]
MIKLASRRAAIVLAGSALTLAVGMVPAQAATTGWRTDATFAVRGKVTIFTGVGASSSSDAWAAGVSAKATATSLPPVIRHWGGKTWRLVTLPAKIAKRWASQTPVLTFVGVSSARSVWVFNRLQGSYLRLDGSRWSLGQLPGGSAKSGALLEIDAVKVFSGTNAWAFGERTTISGTQVVSAPYAAHYNGSKWAMVTVPGLPSGGGAITAVAAVSANDIWAVESDQGTSGLLALAASNPAVAKSAVAASPAARLAAARLRAAAPAAVAPVLLQWTSSGGWQDAAQQPFVAGDQLTSSVTEPNGDVWFGGSASNSANGTSPLTARWNGTSWSVSDLPGTASSADMQVTAMAPDGTGGIWALTLNSSTGAERIWHLHGTTWSQVKPAFGKHRWELFGLALVPRTHSVWGVGAVQGSTKSSANALIAIDGRLPR